MSESTEYIPEGGGLPRRTRDRRAERAIREALRAKLAEDQQAARLVQQESEKLQQVISQQQPKERKSAESAPDEPDEPYEGGEQDLLSPLESKRAEREPDEEEGTGPVELQGVTVSGKTILNGKLSGLKVVAVRVPDEPIGKQRVYAFDPDASVYYRMQAGSSSKTRKTFRFREQLPDAQKADSEGTLEFAGPSSAEAILGAGGAGSSAGDSPAPTPQRVQLVQSSSRIALAEGGGNLYVRNNFLIAVDGAQFSFLRIPAPRAGDHLSWFLAVAAPNNSAPDNRRDITGPVLVMKDMKAFTMAASGPVHLQWQGGRTLGSGQGAPGNRALTVEDLPTLLTGTKIYRMYNSGNNLTLTIDDSYLDEFHLEVKAQPVPPATPDQSRLVGWLEAGLRQLNSGFQRNAVLFAAAGNQAANGVLVVELDGGVHLSIMAADLRRAIASAGQGLQRDVFLETVFQACPYHVTIGKEHWHSPGQTGPNGFLSGKYSNDRLIQLQSQMRSAGVLDQAVGAVRDIGFTIS